jgi:hypothetical protein
MPNPPPRDQHGKITPHDHDEILDDHHIIRHTTPNDVPDGRFNSGAFSESTGGGMSVDIEEWMTADGLDPLHYVTDPTHGAVRLKVGDLRKLGFQVGWDPDDAHLHHGAVWGIGNGSKRKRLVREIATTLKQADGEILPIPRRDPVAQAQSEATRGRRSDTPAPAETGTAPQLETVAIRAADGTILLYDIYVVEERRRTWIGSRRTLAQCQDAFEAHYGLKSRH